MKLMTKELEKKFEKYPLYSQDDKGGDAIVLVKYFSPVGVGTWLITEGNKLPNGDYEMFGYCCLVDDVNAEFGYVMLSELENIQLPFGLKIERDLYLKNNCTLIEAMKQSGLSVPDYLLKDDDIDLSYIKECVDYPTLKENFTKEELVEINNVIKDFDSYVNKYDDGIKDIITEYEMQYGNDNIIEWYEGLKTTKSFIEDFNLEKERIDSMNVKVVPATKIGGGWNWYKYNDGSGHLESPDKKEYMNYDLQTNEYKITDNGEYNYFPLNYYFEDGIEPSNFNPFDYMEDEMINTVLLKEKQEELSV